MTNNFTYPNIYAYNCMLMRMKEVEKNNSTKEGETLHAS